MDEDGDKMTAIKLPDESEQIALVNKVTDPSPKLSEQGLVVYKAMFDHITFFKKQQWTTTNYAALLHGAIFVFAKGLSKESYTETVLLTAVAAATDSEIRGGDLLCSFFDAGFVHHDCIS